ncbi:MAG: gliding motility lipoprotein GldD [Bacteroidales bacterium]
MKKLLLLLLSSISIISCVERSIHKPKQRGYFRIDLPQEKSKSYYSFSNDTFPYNFKLPTYAKIAIDSSKSADPYWLNIQYPDFNATIHISYKHIQQNVNKFVEDAHFLAYKHDIKAEAIRVQEFHYEDKKVHGLLFDIKGDAASVKQFFVTDSIQHFVRGALYFNVPPNKDSLAPVISYMHNDIVELISNFKWNPEFKHTQ